MKPLHPQSERVPPATDGRWHPPSDRLVCGSDGVWRSRARSPISYPAEANDAFLTIEESSYWFRHRMACLRALLKRLPPAGDFYDIGGGNGFVAAGLDAAGYPSVLVEPGSGAINAARRGVRRIVQATLQDAAFRPHALAAAGALDVIEHVEHDVKFLRLVRERLRPGGRFYCTVPAAPALWSHEDERAGHFRRYRADTLSGALRRASFEVEFVSPFFTWLVAPVFFCRALPSRLHRGTVSTTDWSAGAPARDHSPPAALAPFVARVHAWELRRLQSGRALPFGTSLIAVARAF